MRLIFFSILIMFSTITFADSESIGLVINDKIVHPGCIRELFTQLNGDEIVGSIHVSSPYSRSCMNSNKYSQEYKIENNYVRFQVQDPVCAIENLPPWTPEFGYKVEHTLDKSTYILHAFESLQGSMGAFSEFILVRIEDKNYIYYSNGKLQKKLITHLIKLGELPKSQVSEFVELYPNVP